MEKVQILKDGEFWGEYDTDHDFHQAWNTLMETRSDSHRYSWRVVCN
jgi:hypothetical protein